MHDAVNDTCFMQIYTHTKKGLLIVEEMKS